MVLPNKIYDKITQIFQFIDFASLHFRLVRKKMYSDPSILQMDVLNDVKLTHGSYSHGEVPVSNVCVVKRMIAMQ